MPRPVQALAAVSWILLVAGAGALGQQPYTPNALSAPAVNATWTQGVGPGYWPTAGGDLTLNLSAGTALCGNPPAPTTYAGGTLTMANNATNYVYLDPTASCMPASNPTGFPVGFVPIAQVSTSGGSITLPVVDLRSWFVDPNTQSWGVRADLVSGATPGAKIATALTEAGTNGTAVAPYWLGAGDTASSGPAGSMLWDLRSGSPLFKLQGNTDTALQPGFTAVAPLGLGVIDGTVANDSQHQPALWVSRRSNATATNCDNNNLLTSCDSPIVRIDGTNQQTGLITNMFGEEIDMWGFASNTAGTGNAPFVAGLGVQMSDQPSTPNVTNMEGINIASDVFSVAGTTSGGGFTRYVYGMEIDSSNYSGSDSVYPGASSGNNTGGLSLVAIGANNTTYALGIGSSASSTKGFRTGVGVSGVVECGVCVLDGGAGNSVSPTYGLAIQSTSNYGILVGSGTQNVPASTLLGHGYPTIGIQLDATGTKGAPSRRASNTLRFASTDATPTEYDWDQFADANQNLLFNYGGVSKVIFEPPGYVGIGTSTPSYLLDVVGGSARVTNPSGTSQLTVSGSATSGRLGQDATGVFLTSDTNGGALRFDTNNGSLNEWMRITSAGLVGIGTTGPVSALNVAGTTGLTWTSGGNNLGLATFGTPATGGSLYLNTHSLSSSFQSGLGIDGTYGSPDKQSVVNIRALGVKSGSGYGSQLAFWTTKDTALNQVMTVDRNGNVGIGTTSPSLKLQVANGAMGAGVAPSPTCSGTPVSCAFDGSQGNTQVLTLSANSYSTIGGLATGEVLNFVICQGGTVYSFSWPTTPPFKGAATVSSIPNACIAQSFVYDGTNMDALPRSGILQSQTVNLASVATGACSVEQSVTVNGALLGDAVSVTANTALEAGGFLVGKVSGADTVKWQFCNLSAAAIDRANDTYNIFLNKQ